MNYITEINKFEQQNCVSPLSPMAQLLWYRLMHYANKNRWPERFSYSNGEIMRTMMISERVLRTCRSELIEKGFLTYESGTGRRLGQYILHPLGDVFGGTQSTLGGTNMPKKEKNQKKEIYNNKYLYKQNANDAYQPKYDYDEIARRALLKVNRKEICDVLQSETE